MENWRPIKGFEDKYEVSDKGNVRSLSYRNTDTTNVLTPVADRKGYLMVGLCRNCKMKWEKVHRLVASAFIPNPKEKPQVNHINGNKADNRSENLEWVTARENLIHAYKSGLKQGSVEYGKMLGESQKDALIARNKENTKPVIATNLKTGEKILFESAAEVERVLGINHASVPRVCKGKQKAAKGYSFRYADQEEAE